MKRPWTIPALGYFLIIVIWLASTPASAADTGACLPVVVPLEGPGFVQLDALSIDARLECTQGQCNVTADERLYLTNSDEVKAATIRLGIVDCAASLGGLAAQGAEVRSEGEAFAITLAPRGKADVMATVTTSSSSAPILRGTIALAQASRWGAVGDILATLRWPGLTGTAWPRV